MNTKSKDSEPNYMKCLCGPLRTELHESIQNKGMHNSAVSALIESSVEEIDTISKKLEEYRYFTNFMHSIFSCEKIHRDDDIYNISQNDLYKCNIEYLDLLKEQIDEDENNDDNEYKSVMTNNMYCFFSSKNTSYMNLLDTSKKLHDKMCNTCKLVDKHEEKTASSTATPLCNKNSYAKKVSSSDTSIHSPKFSSTTTSSTPSPGHSNDSPSYTSPANVNPTVSIKRKEYPEKSIDTGNLI